MRRACANAGLPRGAAGARGSAASVRGEADAHPWCERRSRRRRETVPHEGAVVLIVLSGAYLFGFQRGHAGVSAERANHAAQLRKVETQAASTQAGMAKVQSLADLTAARCALLQAVLDLDQRNFGTANSHLREAARLAGGLDAAAGGVDAARLGNLRSELAATDLNVVGDLATERQKVLALADEMTAIASKSDAPPVAP